MTIRGLILLILEAVFLFLSLGLGTREIYIISLTIGAFILYSALSVILSTLLLRIRGHLSCDTVNRTEQVIYTVNFKGFVFLPVVGEIKILPPGTREKFAKEIVTHTFLLIFGITDKKYDFPLNCEHKGYWSIGINSLYFKDIFGLFSIRALSPFKLKSSRLPIEVRPNAHQLSIYGRRLSTSNGFAASAINSSSSGDMLGDVREYREGDPLKRVHWKQSAKMKKLFVREFEEQENPQTLIIIDTASFHPNLEKVADISCEVAYSLVKFYSDNGKGVRVVCCRENENQKFSNNEFFVDSDKDLDKACGILTGLLFNEDTVAFDLNNVANTGADTAGTVHIITNNPSKFLFDSVSALSKKGINVCCIVPQIDGKACELVKNFNRNFYKEPIIIETSEEISERLEEAL